MPHISISHPQSRFPQYQLQFQSDLHFNPNEQIALIGPNGSGKTLFVNYLLGKVALKGGQVLLSDAHKAEKLSWKAIQYIAFKDIMQLSAGFDQYYQKRWNATENEESPLVSEILGQDKAERARELFGSFQIERLLEKRLIYLSSGEMRKLQVTEALLAQPQLLIIDNPYIGLDAAAREILNQILQQLISEKGLQVMLVLCNPQDIPPFIDRVLPIVDKCCLEPVSRDAFLQDTALQHRLFPELARDLDPVAGGRMASHAPSCNYRYVLRMNKVNLRYYQKQILKDIDWEVKRGEKWALLGKNGSGKSSLLSMVCADNPQAYANDIQLFDRQRGSGESIWSIKAKIGYLSPEMHHYYRQDISCLKVVASGFFDTIGLYRQPVEAQLQSARSLMECFGAAHLADKPFLQCSYGEQRLILLVRVFVKQPPVVILDEPLHGLDAGKKKLALQLIEQYCRQADTSLIYVTHYEEEIPPCVHLRKVISGQ